MTWEPDALADIKRFETCVLSAYWDDIGHCWTIGWGHTGAGVREGLIISQDDADRLLDADFTVAVDDLTRNASWWQTSPEPVRRGLSNMSFQLGWPRLSGFENMLEAGVAGDYERMAHEGMNSAWARQVPSRARFVTDLFLSAVEGATS